MLCKFPGHVPLNLGRVVVLGFSFSRRSAITALSFDPDKDDNWETEIYKHPARQVKKTDTVEGMNALKLDGGQPGDILRFQKMHDIYSLGVVLLEIGLWQDIGDVVKGLEQAKPEKRKEDLLAAAEHLLPVSMGDKFARVVRRCLQIVENEDITAGQVLECLEDSML